MTENKYQDEKQTIAEKLKTISAMNYEDFIEKYEELCIDTDIEIDWCSINPFYCIATITTDDGKEQIYLPRAASIYSEIKNICETCYKTIDIVLDNQASLYDHKSQQMCCATYSLDKIKEMIISFEFLEKEGLINKEHNNFYYLFINPRKEVVEYALANKEYFCPGDFVQKFFIQGFVADNQVNPELKELILKELQ